MSRRATSERQDRRSGQVEPWMEQLAWLMDEAIPLGGRWSIGLDGLFGLIPGLGDLASSVISSLIIVRAAHIGLPRAAIFRMVMNVGIDSLFGSIPFVGDLFDFVHKANVKNIEIYRQHVEYGRSSARDWGFIILAIVIL